MSLSLNYPLISPSLSLDFASTKQLDPRITFTRASTGTFYNGVTTAKAEENLVIRSQEFNDGIWGKNALSITADTTIAPDGTTTADTVTADGTSTAHNFFYTTSATLNGTFAFSLFVKAGTSSFIQIRTGTDSAPWANFDVSTGVLGTVNAGTTATITAVANGFYRCSISFSTTTAQAIAIGLVTSATAARNESNTLNTTVFIWGAQLEQRSAVTAYTVTTTQPITNYVPVLQTAQNNVARFEHNPITGESLGLEIEEQRTNLLLRSEDFADAAWFKTDATITSNTIVAPDGALTGDKLVENTATSAHAVSFGGVSVTSGTSYSFSCFVKAGERTSVRFISNVSSNFHTAYFNLLTGAVTTTTGTGTVATIVNVGNGWYRCVLTFSAAATIINADFAIRTVSGTSTDNYTGNGYAGIFIWGAQLEAGAFPTSYIPTVASQVTRSADAASMTGANFSSWFNNAEGTLYMESPAIVSTSNRTLTAISDNSANNRISFQCGAGNTVWNPIIVSGGVTQATLTQSISFPPQSNPKLCVAYKVNDFAGTTSGAPVVTDTSGVVPMSMNTLYIGGTDTGFVNWNSTIKKLAYYPARLTNAQLQALTGL